MDASKGRFEEFGSTSWVGLVLAAVVVIALRSPLAQAHASAAHTAPPAAHVAAALHTHTK